MNATERLVRDVASRKLSGDDLSVFVRFMCMRFPNERSEAYVQEWVDRYCSGRAISCMDCDSRKAYLEALEWL